MGDCMKKCQCGKNTEGKHYDYCHSCWQIQDPRNYFKEKLRKCLDQMTSAALEFDMIFAQSIEAAKFDYEPKHGPKLYWNSQTQCYVVKLPDGTEIGAKGR